MFWGIIILAIVWVVAFLIILCIAGIRRRWLRKNELTA
jgi:threonine/homoserine/homoserine lactone efflux protein